MNDCVFCHLEKSSWIYETEHFFVVWDIDPIQNGHMLLISKAHRMSLSGLREEEMADFIALQKFLLEKIEKDSDWGATLAVNNGRMMDKGVHFHGHIIPRYSEDGFWDTVTPKERSFDKENFLRKL